MAETTIRNCRFTGDATVGVASLAPSVWWVSFPGGVAVADSWDELRRLVDEGLEDE
jgi:hypothetical protein